MDAAVVQEGAVAEGLDRPTLQDVLDRGDDAVHALGLGLGADGATSVRPFVEFLRRMSAGVPDLSSMSVEEASLWLLRMIAGESEDDLRRLLDEMRERAEDRRAIRKAERALRDGKARNQDGLVSDPSRGDGEPGAVLDYLLELRDDASAVAAAAEELILVLKAGRGG